MQEQVVYSNKYEKTTNSALNNHECHESHFLVYTILLNCISFFLLATKKTPTQFMNEMNEVAIVAYAYTKNTHTHTP